MRWYTEEHELRMRRVFAGNGYLRYGVFLANAKGKGLGNAKGKGFAKGKLVCNCILRSRFMAFFGDASRGARVYPCGSQEEREAMWRVRDNLSLTHGMTEMDYIARLEWPAEIEKVAAEPAA